MNKGTLMQKLIKYTLLLLIGALWTGLGLPLSATTIFDNVSHDQLTRLAPGALEVGDQIVLGSPERYLTNFAFQFWGTNTANSDAFTGTVQARVRFYQNNGPLTNGSPAPGTNFYDSGWFGVAPTPRSTVTFAAGVNFPWAGLFLPVASDLTWSVQFRGMGPTDSVGVDLYTPPAVGQDLPDYWENNGSTWILKTNNNGAHIDFAARLEASAQPASNPSPLWLTNVVSGTSLNLSWASNQPGWTLQTQTNASRVGVTANWNTVAGSRTTNRWSLPIESTKGSVFSRLAYEGITSFWDDFTRANDPGTLAPWIGQAGTWTVTGGVLQAGTNTPYGYGSTYITNSWGDYSVQAQLQFPAGAYGGGIGGRLNPATGAHYAAWVYPENSPGGSSVIKLIKFQTWTNWGYTNSAYTPMAQATLPAVGTGWHTVTMVFLGTQIKVYYDASQVLSVTDVEAQPYLSGAVSLDLWTDAYSYTAWMDNVVVIPQ